LRQAKDSRHINPRPYHLKLALRLLLILPLVAYLTGSGLALTGQPELSPKSNLSAGQQASRKKSRQPNCLTSIRNGWSRKWSILLPRPKKKSF